MRWIPRASNGWLVTALKQSGPDQVWDIIADSEVERLRNSTIVRSVIEDHRKVAFFGGVVIKAVDHGLSGEVKQKFRANDRGPVMGASRFDISVERLIAAITGPKSTVMVGQFFNEMEHFRRYYASLFLNCRDKPLCSYLFYSRRVRTAYLIALSNNEISPLFSQEQDIADRWIDLTVMHAEYSRYMTDLRSCFPLNSPEFALKFFRSKISDQTPQYSICLSLDYEELQDWLNKTVYNANCGTPANLHSEIVSNFDSGQRSLASRIVDQKVLILLGLLRFLFTRSFPLREVMILRFLLIFFWMRLVLFLSIRCTRKRTPTRHLIMRCWKESLSNTA